MNQMTVNQGCILHHLKRHSELKSIEIAEDLERDVKEVEEDLSALVYQKLAAKIYTTDKRYVWKSLVKVCPTCRKDMDDKPTKYCSTSCASFARRGSSGKSGEIASGRSLPDWGGAYLLDGEFFKIGHLDKIYRWGVDEWRTSERSLHEIQCGVFGRFWGGRFQPEMQEAAE